MSGPGGVMAFVLAESAAGGAAILFLSPLWNEVRRGFFVLTGAVVLALAAGGAGAAASSRAPGIEGTGVAVWLAVAVAAATLLWLVLLAARAHLVARALGGVTVLLAVAMLVAFARVTGESLALSVFQLLAGALFTGAVLDGLLLGHWYLTDRRLTRAPINRMTWVLIASVVVEAAAVVSGFGEGESSASTSLNPLLSVGGSASWIALGMVACTGLIAAFIRLTLRGTRPTAVQSATGFFYLAVITAFTAEIAAKVRILP